MNTDQASEKFDLSQDSILAHQASLQSIHAVAMVLPS
jgi:hypothetical protein